VGDRPFCFPLLGRSSDDEEEEEGGGEVVSINPVCELGALGCVRLRGEPLAMTLRACGSEF
jgi:hypothetical protein